MIQTTNFKILMTVFLLGILFLNSLCEDLEGYDDYEDFGFEISEIGDPCNDTEAGICGPPNFWLQCVEEECVCLDGMINLNIQDPCISKIDSPCDDSSGTPKACIANAQCLDAAGTGNKTCGCNEGYLAVPNKELCLLTHDAECVTHEECNNYAVLKCRNEKCSCEDLSIWDQVESKCRSTVEIGNFCDLRETTKIPVPCVANADCLDHSCFCMENYKETSTHECKLVYGQNCTTDPQCHPNYKCVANPTVKQCGCDPINQIHHAGDEVCTNLLGKPCHTSTNPYCVENAMCSSTTNICICDAGFSQSAEGKCVRGFEGDCASDPDICNTASMLECNPETLRCDCIMGYEYNAESKKCLGLSEANCTVAADCIALATCSAQNECECKNGYSATPANQCLLTYEQTCQGPLSCNPYEFLTCDLKEHTCTCESSELVFSPEKGSCVSTPDGICFLTPRGDRLLECVGNATCAPGEVVGGDGICNCEEGYNVVDNACLKAGSVAAILLNSVMGLTLVAFVVVFG